MTLHCRVEEASVEINVERYNVMTADKFNELIKRLTNMPPISLQHVVSNASKFGNKPRQWTIDPDQLLHMRV